MQNAIFIISHFQVSGSLDIKTKKRRLCADCLFIVFFYSFPHLSEYNLSPILSFACAICCSSTPSLCALTHARQTQADGPSVRQDEPCHEPQTDIMLTLRPSSNHLSPACCATPLDSKLRHTFAIPSRTVFCQHWATFFPHSEASSPRRLRNHLKHRLRCGTFSIDSPAVGMHVRFKCRFDLWDVIKVNLHIHFLANNIPAEEDEVPNFPYAKNIYFCVLAVNIINPFINTLRVKGLGSLIHSLFIFFPHFYLVL